MVVPVPPLIMPRVPVTSEEPKATAPLLSSPDTDLTMPVPKEERVVEPLTAILKKEAPVVEATAKMGKTWEEVEATTYREAPAGVEVLISKDLAVLSQRKLAEEAVEEAAVA